MNRFIFILIFCVALCSCGIDSKDSSKDGLNNAAETLDYNTDTSSGQRAAQDIQQMEQAAQNAKIEVRPFKSEGGWGYDIYMDDKLYVHQPHIPAVSGRNAFKSEADARKAGDLVVYKIKNNILPPSMTVEELDSLGVLK